MAGQRIGILDSGVGGLSVLKDIRARMPDLDVHYVGDSAWCPYGTKSPGEICERVGKIVDYFQSHEISLIVIACNSATIHAVEWLRSIYPIPFVGMEPGVKPASAVTQTGVIGVLATEASIQGEKFLRLVDSNSNGVNVITQTCPKFVELVERGKLAGPEVDAAIDEYTGAILQKNADVLVLGCTHFPFLRESLEKKIPSNVKVLDTGNAVARRVESLVTNSGGTGQLFIETTGDRAFWKKLIPVLMPGYLKYQKIGKLCLNP